MIKAPGSKSCRGESHVFGVIRQSKGQSRRRTGEVREEKVSRKQELDSFGPLGEVGQVTRSSDGSSFGESSFSRIPGAEGQLQRGEA